MDSIISEILPDLIDILDNGIPFDYQIEPVAIAQCCRLNMIQTSGVTVTGDLNHLVYICHGRRIARVLWFADGVEFMVLWNSPMHLSAMINIVIDTIEELHNG